jgi:hypothetical protein
VRKRKKRMNWIPYGRFAIGSPLLPEEVQRKLAEAIGPQRWFRLSHPEPLRGRVAPNLEFRIWRHLQWSRNSFQPIFVGRISSIDGGSRISARTNRIGRERSQGLSHWVAAPVRFTCSRSRLSSGRTH